MEKEILSFSEFIKYCDISKSRGYQAVQNKELPYYKPTEGKLYFKHEDIKAWLLRGRVSATTETQQ